MIMSHCEISCVSIFVLSLSDRSDFIKNAGRYVDIYRRLYQFISFFIECKLCSFCLAGIPLFKMCNLTLTQNGKSAAENVRCPWVGGIVWTAPFGCQRWWIRILVLTPHSTLRRPSWPRRERNYLACTRDRGLVPFKLTPDHRWNVVFGGGEV